jgi:hypothetical protein
MLNVIMLNVVMMNVVAPLEMNSFKSVSKLILMKKIKLMTYKIQLEVKRGKTHK